MALLAEVVPGDGIGMTCWPWRVTVLGIQPGADGMQARVSWRSPEGAEGITWLSRRALVRVFWDFRSQAARDRFDPGPVPVRDLAEAMARAQRDAGIGAPPGDDAMAALLAALERDPE